MAMLVMCRYHFNMLRNLMKPQHLVSWQLAGTTCPLIMNLSSRRYPMKGSLSLMDSIHRGQRQYSKRTKNKSRDTNGQPLSSVVQPVKVELHEDPVASEIAQELAGVLERGDVLKVLNTFYRRKEAHQVVAESGIDDKLFQKAFVSFRRFCAESKTLPVDIHVLLSDIIKEAGHVDDILPYFLEHCRVMYPHLECMDDLRKISDLRRPANWYPEARSMQRKIIYHAGPTNSGKTYHALKRFLSAKTGVYCGPLRLLANEVFHKSNAAGTDCDLVTGEERLFVKDEGAPSDHVACTVEMTSVQTQYEVAVIDEIQMMRDGARGWAWTRAFLGVCAQEIHVCGEGTAVDLVEELALEVGDEVEVRRYKRLTPLTMLDQALRKFENVRPGDCIVCFSKNDIYYVIRQLEKRGILSAVIYGTLPAAVKLAQASKFNDPNDPCKVLVATDAIGMGLNLNIKRIIFYSLMKPTINEKGEKDINVISPSSALQIAGRAGRYGTQFEDGEVTTYKSIDVAMLSKLLDTPIDDVERAGLHPTADQIEMFAYHLPNATLTNLIDIFTTLSQVDRNRYFLCLVESFTFLADMIEHIPLALRVRYVFCTAPVNIQRPFICTMVLKFARRFSRGEPILIDWLCRQLNWPLSIPTTIQDLAQLETVFDVLDIYLWLGFRFQDMFPHMEHVRDIQLELDGLIQKGVLNITRLLRKSESAEDSEDVFTVRRKAQLKHKEVAALDQETTDTKLIGAAPKRRGEKMGNVQNGKLVKKMLQDGVLTKNMLENILEDYNNGSDDEKS